MGTTLFPNASGCRAYTCPEGYKYRANYENQYCIGDGGCDDLYDRDFCCKNRLAVVGMVLARARYMLLPLALLLSCSACSLRTCGRWKEEEEEKCVQGLLKLR